MARTDIAEALQTLIATPQIFVHDHHSSGTLTS